MTVELRRLTIPLTTIRQLAAVMQDPSHIESEPLGTVADFGEVRSVFDRFHNDNAEASSVVRAKLDRELAAPLHRALTGLSRRDATDMQFWRWLCVCQFQDVVWYRYYGHMPVDFSGTISPSLAERFLGSPTLRGVSRNALARLWWCAEALYTEEDKYDLVNIALSRQELFQGIFERMFGLYIPAARACLRVLNNSSEDEIRQATKELNHYFTTIVAEALSEEDIIHNLLNKYFE